MRLTGGDGGWCGRRGGRWRVFGLIGVRRRMGNFWISKCRKVGGHFSLCRRTFCSTLRPVRPSAGELPSVHPPSPSATSGKIRIPEITHHDSTNDLFGKVCLLPTSDSSIPPSLHNMKVHELARWTRFAAKGGIGKCTAVHDCVAQSSDDLMFLKVRFSLGVVLGFECVSRCLISPPTLCTGRRDHCSYANARTA